MQEGPSKDELQNYWNNSRQYFDELANYYRQSDSEYYNKYIAPFYNNPFRAATPQNSSAASKLIVVLILFAILAAGAAGMFFVFASNKQESYKQNKNPDNNVTTPHTMTDTINATKLGDSVKVVTASANYNIAMAYFHTKDFDNAEKYFKMVPPEDKNYRSSMKYLKEIEIIKETEGIAPTPQPDNRKQPIKRIR